MPMVPPVLRAFSPSDDGEEFKPSAAGDFLNGEDNVGNANHKEEGGTYLRHSSATLVRFYMGVHRSMSKRRQESQNGAKRMVP